MPADPDMHVGTVYVVARVRVAVRLHCLPDRSLVRQSAAVKVGDSGLTCSAGSRNHLAPR